MSSSENEDVSHSDSTTLEQVNQQCNAILSSLNKVKVIIDEEVEFANYQTEYYSSLENQLTPKAINSQVSARIAFFENKSTEDLPNSPFHWISGLPLYPIDPTQRKGSVSLPVSPEYRKVRPMLTTTPNMENQSLALTGATQGNEEVDINNSLQNANEEGEEEYDEAPPPRSRFARFVVRLTVSVNHFEFHTNSHKTILQNGNQLDQLTIQNMKSDAERFANDLKEFAAEYHSLATTEEYVSVGDLNNANNMINKSQKQICDLQNRINISYPTITPPAQPTNQLG